MRTVKKVYSVETEILQAFWCRFSKTRKTDREGGEQDRNSGRDSVGDTGENDGERLMCICVREQGCLTLFAQTGTTHYVPLPFPVSLHGLAYLHNYCEVMKGQCAS